MKPILKKIISLFTILFMLLNMFVIMGAQEMNAAPKEGKVRLAKVDSNLIKTYAIKLPDSLDFAGENIPLNNFDVRERLERELLINTYWQSQTVYIMENFNQAYPIIEPILKKYGIPDDFIYLAVAESGLQNVVSNMGASGVWQFMAPSAQSYGLEVSSNIDERYNLEKSTEAACKYFLDAYHRFGSWTLAAVAYDMGPDNLAYAMQIQKQSCYFDLYLNQETSRYIFRILALKEILHNPRQYGYYVGNGNLFPVLKYKTMIVDTTINSLANFAHQNNTTYRMLKLFNPWLLTDALTNTAGKTYSIKIPTDTSEISEGTSGAGQ
jgi:membrane-bound lytic murein transglycosylase D